MPKRTPQIAQETAVRKVAESTLERAVNRLKRYCDAEVVAATPRQPVLADERATISVDKALYYRVVSQCRMCNTGHIDLLSRDFQQAKNNLPIFCAQNMTIVALVLEDKPEAGLMPISIHGLGG